MNGTTAEPRRGLHFKSVHEILDDVVALDTGEVRATGRWTSAQVVQHIADSIHRSIDGFQGRAPREARLRAQAAKEQMLAQGIPAGIEPPDELAHLMPDARVTWDDAVCDLRLAIERLEGEHMTAEHPFFGHLREVEWIRYHCRHAELHLSFLWGA